MEVAGTIVASTFKLTSPLLKEFSLLWGVEKDLKALENIISTVKDVLEYAEKCNTIEMPVYNWLKKLKQSVYDADDLLDKLYLEAQRQEHKKSCGQTSKVINSFFSKSNLVKRLKLAHQIKSINKRLDAIASERQKFQFNINEVPHRDIGINNCETWSIIDEGEIYRRDHEKEAIITQLIQDDGSESISIIPIVGMGGLGKTTLAGLSYNNEIVKGYFGLRMWVYVSQSFNLKRILRSMIEQAPSSCDTDVLELLGQLLKSELKGKKLLPVLDDYWSENIEEWEYLKSVIKYGALGKIWCTWK